MEQNHSGYILMPPYKSTAIAIMMALVLGFIGLLYASWWAGVIFSIVGVILLAIPKYGLGLFVLCWILCPFIAAKMVERHNNKLQKRYLSK